MGKEFGLTINVGKTKVMKIGKNKELINVLLEGKTIEQVNSSWGIPGYGLEVVRRKSEVEYLWVRELLKRVTDNKKDSD